VTIVNHGGVSAEWASGTLLHALGDTDREALLRLGTRRTYQAGASLITEGSTDADIFLLLDGWAKVFGNTVDGRSVLLSIRTRGDLVGELAALDERPRSATVVAATTVVAQAVTRRAFLRYLDERPPAAKAIYATVVDELRQSTRYRLSTSGAPIAVRLAFVLTHLADAYGRPRADGVHIDVPLSQQELASLIGVSEPSLHRALTDMRARNLIRTRYRQLVVCDPAALRALTSDSTG
jgi:CRP-like cAMP-binding protein